MILWEEIVEECYDEGLSFVYPIVKVIYTGDKSARAVILRKSAELYTIAFERLCAFEDEELQYIENGARGYWSPTLESMRSIFDTEIEAVAEVYSVSPFKNEK